eukprot:TRINITY_DN12561_c0_g1_i1.p1 TRINITY_DN12561_c0_g1~~TRINITY_DN12561_c0_g1_i1.p1  ORF type:complete len:385 (-),score=76.01 TRINITY_DN12561_c0_g1_i1:790-1944(-)
MPKASRPKRSFNFIEQGKYMDQAERIRNRALKKEAQGVIKSEASEVKREEPILNLEGFGSPNVKDEMVIIKELQEELEQIPEVEWWDALILKGDEQNYGDQETKYEFDDDLWLYVEHPVPIPPANANNGQPAALPLMLTKEERKKLRRRIRNENQKDKRERILLGIDLPPPPKTKISNLYRVMTAEAVADPTQIEKEVKKQMDERVANHEARNHARMLTPLERKEKKINKLKNDREKDLICAVFRVRDLSHKLFKAKIDHTAQESYLTGAMVVYTSGSINLVIAEGGFKSIKKFKKLMLSRIDWANPPPSLETKSDAMGGESVSKGPNKCVLVWEGSVKLAKFDHFVIKTCPTEAMARKFLQNRCIPHFWEMAKNFPDPFEPAS